MARRPAFPARPPPPTEWPAGVACAICQTTAAGAILDAGGSVGLAHEACFVAWDRCEEVLEVRVADLAHTLNGLARFEPRRRRVA